MKILNYKKLFLGVVLIAPLNGIAQKFNSKKDNRASKFEINENSVVIQGNTKKVYADSLIPAASSDNQGNKKLAALSESEIKNTANFYEGRASNAPAIPSIEEIAPTPNLSKKEAKVKDEDLSAFSIKNTSNNQLSGFSPLPPKPVADNLRYKHVPLAGETDYYTHKNSEMLKYCMSYANIQRKRFVNMQSKGDILSTIDQILKKHDLPEELKYLAVIESALNKNALSRVGALGYWQFMAGTARHMGLVVSRNRDDRRDLHKSTHAAAKYLSYLYDMLDDWLLVVGAYNSGPRPIINAIKRTGKSDFWSIKKYLPAETQNHVMAFIATATIMERLPHLYAGNGIPRNFDWSSLNFNRAELGKNIANQDKQKAKHPLLSRFSEEEVKSMAIIRIKKPLDLEIVCQTLDISRRTLGRWNYDYFDFLATYKIGNTYNFRIPKDKLEKFIEKLSYLERASAQMNS